MSLQAMCQSCGKSFTIPANLSVSRAKCKHCGGKLAFSGISRPSDEMAKESDPVDLLVPEPIVRQHLPPSAGQRWVIGTAMFFLLFFIAFIASVQLYPSMVAPLHQFWSRIPLFSKPEVPTVVDQIEQNRSEIFVRFF